MARLPLRLSHPSRYGYRYDLPGALYVRLGIRATNASTGFKITTGAAVSVIAVGRLVARKLGAGVQLLLPLPSRGAVPLNIEAASTQERRRAGPSLPRLRFFLD